MAEEAVLGYLENHELIVDSGEFSVEHGIAHEELVNVIKSLNGFQFVIAQVYFFFLSIRLEMKVMV